MATRQSLQFRVMLMALLCAASVAIVSWKAKRRRALSGPTTGPAATAADRRQDWREIEVSADGMTGVFEIEISADGMTGVFEIGLFRSPIPFKPLPLDQTRRDTPLDTWVSWKSHAAAGTDAADLERLAAHHIDPEYLPAFVRDKLKLTPAEYFQRLRTTEGNSRAIGTAKYGEYVLVLYSFDGGGQFADRTYTISTPMINQGDTWYIDARAPDRNPVLQKAISDDLGLSGAPDPDTSMRMPPSFSGGRHDRLLKRPYRPLLNESGEPDGA